MSESTRSGAYSPFRPSYTVLLMLKTGQGCRWPIRFENFFIVMIMIMIIIILLIMIIAIMIIIIVIVISNNYDSDDRKYESILFSFMRN